MWSTRSYTLDGAHVSLLDVSPGILALGTPGVDRPFATRTTPSSAGGMIPLFNRPEVGNQALWRSVRGNQATSHPFDAGLAFTPALVIESMLILPLSSLLLSLRAFVRSARCGERDPTLLSPPPGPTDKVARRDDLVLELERCDGLETPLVADMVSFFYPSEGTVVGPLLTVRATGQRRRWTSCRHQKAGKA